MKHFKKIIKVLGAILVISLLNGIVFALEANYSDLHKVKPFISSNERYNPFEDELINGEKFQFTQTYFELPGISESGKKFHIRYTRWMPSEEFQNGKIIIYNHGLQSHRGWFNNTAEELFNNGYTIYAFDRIGCGESSVVKGELYESLSGDDDPMTMPVARGDLRNLYYLQGSVRRMIDIAADENPENEIWLWANSYAGKIITRYILKNGTDKIAGAILTTPGNFRDEDTLPLPFPIDDLLFSASTDHFKIPMIEIDNNNGAHWFTDDPYWYGLIVNDELSTRYVTSRFYINTIGLDILTQYPADASKLKETPVFYLMVEGDILMNNDKMVPWIQKHDENYFIKFYQGGVNHKHFLTFTEDRDEVIDDIMNYISGNTDLIERIFK